MELSMLSPNDLMALRRSLRDEHVLSVFVDKSASDPAEQRAWRTALDNRFVALRDELQGSSADEREQFERCVDLAVEALNELRPAGAVAGWAAFVAADGVRELRALTVGAPTSAMWSRGAWLLPCLPDAREDHAVIALADSRHTSIHVYRGGVVELMDGVRAHHEVQNPPLHMGTPSRPGFHPGTHGETGHDAAQRGALAGRDHMIADAVERVLRLAGDDACILVAGIKAVRARLLEDLTAVVHDRVLELESLDVHASAAEIADAVRTGASRLRDALDSRRIHEIVEAAGPHGLGAVGAEATKDALDHSCVRQLYMTGRYIAEHPIEAEVAVRESLDQNARVEEVSGSAAELLDGLGGIAAALRFRPTATGATRAA
jgi:hypothetical protein